VFSYPSSGGIILKTVVGVELDYVDLPRTETAQCHQEDAIEDAFALKLLQLGARWWPSLKFYHRHPDAPYPYGYHYPPDRHVGYPSSGGVVIFELFADNSTARLEEYDAPEKPETWARMALSASMDERCAVLMGFGATLFEDRERCDKLPKTLEQGIAEGKRYEELTRKMEDGHYLDRWMESL
jgi:hypothetical protein